MPELPDLTVDLEALVSRILGRRLERVRLASPFVLRTVDPPLRAAEGLSVTGLRRIGKQLVFALEDGLFVLIHLMVAGRLHWEERGAELPRRVGLAAFDFDSGALLLTEASSKKCASLHLVRGEQALSRYDQGGIEPIEADRRAFRDALTRRNHTFKRALTDPQLFSGIGNAYSDEILHRARLSPAALTQRPSEEEVARLRSATRSVLLEWCERLRAEIGPAFPQRVTADRAGMAVHGRFGLSCPDGGTPVQRIVYAENQCNYCPRCQTGGKLLADRALSRLLRSDWPRTLEELEALRGGGRASAPGRGRPERGPGRLSWEGGKRPPRRGSRRDPL